MSQEELHKTLSDEEREELIAFLDGELAGEEGERIEARLITEVSTKREAEALQRTWDILALLPLPEAKVDFSQRTAELAVSESQSLLGRSGALARVGRSAKRLGWALLAILVLALGVLTSRSVIPDQHRELIENLEVVQDLHALEATGSLAFLVKLRESGAFASPASALAGEAAIVPPAAHPSDNRQWFEAAPKERIEELKVNANRFATLTRGKRNQLAQLRSGLVEASQTDESLVHLYFEYAQWLETLPKQEVDRILLAKNDEERLNSVLEIRKEQDELIAKSLAVLDIVPGELNLAEFRPGPGPPGTLPPWRDRRVQIDKEMKEGIDRLRSLESLLKTKLNSQERAKLEHYAGVPLLLRGPYIFDLSIEKGLVAKESIERAYDLECGLIFLHFIWAYGSDSRFGFFHFRQDFNRLRDREPETFRNVVRMSYKLPTKPQEFLRHLSEQERKPNVPFRFIDVMYKLMSADIYLITTPLGYYADHPEEVPAELREEFTKLLEELKPKPEPRFPPRFEEDGKRGKRTTKDKER